MGNGRRWKSLSKKLEGYKSYKVTKEGTMDSFPTLQPF